MYEQNDHVRLSKVDVECYIADSKIHVDRVVLSITLWLSIWQLFACECSSPTSPTQMPSQKSEQTVKGYIIKHEAVEIDGNKQHLIIITKDGATLFSHTSMHISWLPQKVGESGRSEPKLLDLAGDKSFEYLILNTHSGGAHCCNEYHIFKLGESFEHECIKHHGNGGVDFQSILGQAYVGHARDETFLYYKNFCYANSAGPDIVLTFKEGHFVLDKQAMKRDIPEKDFQAMLQNIKKIVDEMLARKESQGHIDYVLLSWILELIYTGNEAHAWKAFEDFQKQYPLFLSGTDKSHKVVDWAKEKSDLIETIKKSPYYSEILELNQGKIG